MLIYYFYWILFFIPFRLFLPSRVINRKNRPKKRAILSCNHLSAVDPFVIGIHTRRRMHFFAKKELAKSRFLRIMVPAIGSVFVERGQADVGAMKKTLKILKEDNVLMIFPEGSRSKNNEEMQELKAGAVTFAVKTDTCVIPVILWRRPKFLRRNFIYYGRPASFSQYNARMTPEEKQEATLALTEKMTEAKQELRAWLAEKRPRLLARHERKVKSEK